MWTRGIICRELAQFAKPCAQLGVVEYAGCTPRGPLISRGGDSDARPLHGVDDCHLPGSGASAPCALPQQKHMPATTSAGSAPAVSCHGTGTRITTLRVPHEVEFCMMEKVWHFAVDPNIKRWP
mmetsp:Transcript_79330/g.157149  ORF Transcript_79330/g.157149 Transcript_79330/m.157149 type:complete len:124 (-) Transcript_79330:181-552(-)